MIIKKRKEWPKLMTDDLVSEMSDDRISALDYDEPRQTGRNPPEPTRLGPQPNSARQYDAPQYYTDAVPTTSRFRNNAAPSNTNMYRTPASQGGYYATPPQQPQNIVIQQAPPAAAAPRSSTRKTILLLLAVAAILLIAYLSLYIYAKKRSSTDTFYDTIQNVRQAKRVAGSYPEGHAVINYD